MPKVPVSRRAVGEEHQGLQRGPRPQVRYPMLPLKLLLNRQQSDLTIRDLCRQLGITTANYYRWRAEGIPEAQADSMAVHIGYHPALVWGEDWWTPAIESSKRRHASARTSPGAGAAGFPAAA